VDAALIFCLDLVITSTPASPISPMRVVERARDALWNVIATAQFSAR
jgi:hypothetical protein